MKNKLIEMLVHKHQWKRFGFLVAVVVFSALVSDSRRAHYLAIGLFLAGWMLGPIFEEARGRGS